MDPETSQTSPEAQEGRSIRGEVSWKKYLKPGSAIAIAILSAMSIIQAFSSSWSYHPPESGKAESSALPEDRITKDKLLSLAQRNDKLVVGKVHLEGTGWDKKEKSPINIKIASKLFRKTSIRAWSLPCEIDVFIDIGKLKESSFNLVEKEDGEKHLTIKLPEPEIDSQQLESLQTDKLYLVFSEGELESGEFIDFQTKAFGQIREKIKAVVDKNQSTIVRMAKDSAKHHFSCLYKSLGITTVNVEWASPSLQPEAWEVEGNAKSIN